MLNERTKEIFARLELNIPAVAVKYLPTKPEGIKKHNENLAFCQYVKEAQTSEETFYIDKDNDACYGKMSLGMIPKPPVTASGQAGLDFELYKTASAMMKVYQHLPVLVPGAINYVAFSQVKNCSFDPDLIIIFADIKKADIIMRASCYISGDLWESVSTPAISCSWMYAYPLISGKVNHMTTGFYHGLRRRKAFPEGLRMISIPFNKIDEIATALGEMNWTTIAFREDSESRMELKNRMQNWQTMAAEMDCECHLH